MSMDEGANIQSVFLDLSEAYNDRVSISGLLSKLSLIGFDYPSLEWFANFLQHRQQCVRLQSITSPVQTPLSGIPQGTVLGPVHFLIFINDLSELIQNQASFFADDTILHATDKSPLISSCVSLSSDLDKAANWADRWGMLFSAPKSRHLSIGCEAQQSPSVFMKGAHIPQVRTHNHLGLIFNSALTWNDHISNLNTTCARMTRILRRLDGSIPSSSMKKNYTAVIRPRTVMPARYGVEDRLKTPTLTKLIFEKTWNNASSSPEEIQLPHSCASLRHHYRARNWTFDENHFLVSS